MLLIAVSGRSEILDRIAVTVGKHVITEGDVVRNVRVSAFIDQKPVDLSGEQKRKAADRLVDQYLILQEASSSRLPLAAAADAEKLVDQVKAQYPTDAEYRAALVRYRITEEELSDHLLAGLRTLRYTDFRFRPEVQISDEELHEFYDTFAKEGRRTTPSATPSFESSRAQVERLLTDQRVSQALDRWLGTRRNETQILYREPADK